jgi:Domain of unknown function (DUF4352)
MKKLIGGGLAALALGLVGCSATGGAPAAPAITASPITTPSWVHPVVTAPPAPSSKYFLGDTVHNGSLRFTVDSVRRAVVVHDQIGGYYSSPTGNEYFIVKLSVQNVDTHPVFFYYTQTLDLHGQQVSNDTAATVTLNPAINPMIQPGLAIPVELAFIVPEGAQPEAIMLSDALYAISNPLSATATRVELVTP